MNNDITGYDSLPDEEREARLWAYIDGISGEADVIEKLIAAQAVWRATYTELLDLHQQLINEPLDQPSLRFTKNVMEEIARYQITPAAKKYIDSKIIWGITGFFITLFVSFIGYGFSQITWTGAGSSVKTPSAINFNTIDYTKMFNNNFVNGFFMLNIILGLVLLDRILDSRRKKFQKPY